MAKETAKAAKPKKAPAKRSSPKSPKLKYGRLDDEGMVRIYTRLDPKLSNKLADLAAADERPVMQYVRRVLEKHIQEAK